MSFQEFTIFQEFTSFLLSSYPETEEISLPNTKINKEIQKNINVSKKEFRKLVQIILLLCHSRLNIDYIIASLYESMCRDSRFVVKTKNNKVIGFLIYSKYKKKEFKNNIGFQQYKQQQQKVSLLTNFLQSRQNYPIYEINLTCSCSKGYGKKLIKHLEEVIIQEDTFLVIVSKPINPLQKYYKSMNFIYDRNFVDWCDVIYKIIERKS